MAEDPKAAPKRTIGCDDKFHFKCEHVTKTAPSLADHLEEIWHEQHDAGSDEMLVSLIDMTRIIAALRAVEAVRAVCDSQAPRHVYEGAGLPCDYHCAQQIIAEVRASLDGVEAVQALLEGEG